MRRYEFTQKDLRYFAHPFMAQVHRHINAERAFASRSRLSVHDNVALMYWFVAGAEYEDIQNISYYDRPDMEQPGTHEIFEKSRIPIQTIRRKYKDWREAIFLNEKFRVHVLASLLKGSYIAQLYHSDIINWTAGFSSIMFNTNDSRDKIEFKLSQWKAIYECFLSCTKN